MPNSLYFVTSKIEEGPLFEVVISQPGRLATIVFQRSSHATNFLRRNDEAAERTGFSLYGKSYTLTPGPAIPWESDEDLKWMDYPYRERRRLTFARAGLFNSKLTPDIFKADMVALVGQENVELTWVFNAGNGKCWNSFPLHQTSMSGANNNRIKRL